MGTQLLVEGLPAFVAQTILTASSTDKNSLQGIDTTTLVDGALCFVREEPAGTRINYTYRFFRTSAAAPAFPTVVTPSNGPGRWLLISVTNMVEFGDIRLSPSSPPILAEGGPTSGYLFAVGNLVYVEIPLQPTVDTTMDLIVFLGWAPSGAEAGKTVQWQIDVGFEKAGKDVTVIDFTSAVTAPVPDTNAIYAHTGFVVPVANWHADAATDELHIRLSRNATASDPATPPGIHHLGMVQAVKFG